ncbi:precorrin-6y C5,15-methyltransferase (decarboxylating) subunit CbiE [Kushneria phosphatilytica]|uniref:Precorrin-6y C5,15-methyltransferase (Decarboxylating) subunit CbiE n=1 Tax=Kushneria phosphatilytica TaxID=657387 RepID=A0A1S1NSX6_9GAMM|nr:precorrin-6y C5,15-methyltransferase (decarboxylating) subunit CbiE [Kushneria phosphatilytica]OHV08453.1 cobalamin biosynthesis bifunctional protein CbiET [Kushneria phosphatilytica]QEL09882.1 precorrin-6y C5,15-methyltransferase (decarboxylating) subunit CbiE [Kushneria phosphatilytica]
MDDNARAASEKRWLTLVGIGEEGIEGLDGRAREAISAAEVVFGGTRHLALAATLINGQPIAWPSPLSEGIEWLLGHRGRSVVVLASGDPFHYGIGATLTRHVPAEEMRVFAATSAFSLACARMGWPMQTTRLISLHGRPLEAIHPWLHEGARLVVLTSDGEAPVAIAQRLVERGFGSSRIRVLEALNGPRERSHESSAAELAKADREIDPLNVLAVTIAADARARVIALAPGRPDEAFEHDGQITRRDIRAMTLARLAPRHGERLWDIGAGSGSIAIEWLLCDDSLDAVAIEADHERAARIERNAASMGVPRLTVIEGRAPQALAELAEPDTIFVGGGASDTELLALCIDRLRPGGRLIANAVTLETELALGECYRMLGGELTRLSHEQVAPLGGMTGWTPARTIVQWCWHKPHDFSAAP